MRIFSTARKIAAASVAAILIALLPAVVAFANWGPTRPTFTWAQPANYITFDSITDNPTVGDERPFFSGKVSTDPGNVVDNIHVNDNDVVNLRVFFHNDAAANLNLVATNTHVNVYLPKVAATSTFATSTITADNANPAVVSDTVDFNGDRPFTLEYLPGSAHITSNGAVNGATLSDNIVTSSGALIGYNALDGRIPGCSQFSGFVTLQVRVHMQPAPVQPSFACTDLDVAEVDRTHFDFTAHASVQNANVQSYGFTAKDSNGNTVDTNTVSTNALSAVYHFNQSNAGTYTVSAVVNTDHGTSSNANCVKQITVAAAPQVLSSTTPTTTSLPNTGAGDVVGIFTGVSSVGAAGHYVISRRRRGL